MNRFVPIVLLILCPTALAASGSGHTMSASVPAARAHPTRPGYRQLSPQALRAALSHKNFLLVNVHIPYQGQIAGTDRLISFETIGRSRFLPANKNAPIVLYCRSGRMSAIAARTLVAKGYTRVSELTGGFNAWAEAGYPLLQKQGAQN